MTHARKHGRRPAGPDPVLLHARTRISYAAVARRMEACLETRARFDFTGITAPLDEDRPPSLDQEALELQRRGDADPFDPEFLEEDRALTRGSAWIRSIQTGDRLAAQIRASDAPAFSLEPLLPHLDLDDITPSTLAGGLPIPASVLPRLGYEDAVATAVAGAIGGDLVRAVDARIADVAPHHPHPGLLRHLAGFLVLLARSQHDAAMAVASAAGYLRRFRDVEGMRLLSRAAEEAMRDGRLERALSIRCMTMLTVGVGPVRAMIAVDEDGLSVVEMPRGRMSPDAASVSIPIQGELLPDLGDPLTAFRRML